MGKLIIAIVWLTVVVGGVCGWVMNIVALFHSSFTPLTGEVVLRIIGIFVPPVGAVMGYL